MAKTYSEGLVGTMEDSIAKPKVGVPVFKVECYLGAHIVIDDDKIKGALASNWTFNEDEAAALFTAISVKGGDGDQTRYTFISERNDWIVGDVVLCETRYGMTMGKIAYAGSDPVRLESIEGFRKVVARVDLGDMVMARYRELETEAMKKRLYDMKKSFDERLVFKMLAESNSEAAALMAELESRGAM